MALLLLAVGVLLCSCRREKPETNQRPTTSSSDVETVVHTDMLGRPVTLPKDIQRIVLLRTMDVYLLAALLGSEFDDKVIAIGNDFASSDIDGYRKFSEVFDLSGLVRLGSVYTDDGINVETVLGLKPDIVIVDAQFKDRSSVKKMIAVGLPVAFTDLNSDPFYAVERAMRILGKMLGVAAKADEMADLSKERTDRVLQQVDTLLAAGAARPVLYFEQGNTVPEEIGVTDGDITSSWGLIWHRLGAVNIGVGSNFQALHPEKVLSADPDLIVIGGANWDPTANIMRIGFYVNDEAVRDHLTLYTERPGWKQLSAVRRGRLHSLHYNYYVRPCGYAGFEAMAKMLYPDHFTKMNPEADLEDFFDRYMPFTYSGVMSADWKPR